MRNLYQSSSPSIAHQHTYSGTSQIDNVQNHANQTSPKIIQVHQRNNHLPSTCFVNKQAFFQAHHSPKIKTIIQNSGYYGQSPSEMAKAQVPRSCKLSSSSLSSGFPNHESPTNTESNVKPSSILKTKNSAPLIVSSCSSSSSSSSPSPVLKNVHEHQNERFFDSNTLYKKELKQKQRDILSTSITSGCKNSSELSPQKTPQAQLQLQKLQNSLMKHELERQINEMSQSQIQSTNFTNDNIAQNLSRNEKRSTLPHNLNSLNQSTTSNNKVLNLFTNLLNRNKSEPNYISIKNLKRATSSSQFTKSKLNESTSPKSADSKLEAKTSLSSLFKPNKNETKMRRSLDDVARFNAQNSCENDTFISLDNKKYQNTAFSTKNNGLIFLPQKQNLDNYENLDNLENYDTGSNPITMPSSDSYSSKVSEYAVKPSDEILKRINSLTKKSEDSNAFDNIVYSYVDNIRHHSKRLSEINLLNSSAIAAASAAAAAAVSSLNEQNSISVNSNALSCSSGSSSSNSFQSGDTVINPYSNVMTLREKFENIGSESPKSSLKSVSMKSEGLSVNTSVSTGNKNNLNSPALSSVSSASSRSSAISTSLSSGSFSKDMQIQRTDLIEDEYKIGQSEKCPKNEPVSVKNRIVFNYYYEFYRFNLSADESDDEKFKSELENIRILNQKLILNYDKILNDFTNTFYSNNVFLKNILDPILADSLSTYSSNSSLFNFKFTIEFFKPILIAAKMTILPSCSTNFNTESYQMIHQRAETLLEDKFLKEINLNLYEFNSNSYGQLLNELAHRLSTVANHEMNKNDFDNLKSKLVLFILYKLEYFNDEIKIVQRASEINDKLGVKIQKDLENQSNMSSLEMEKFKLLVNESDVITSLLLKLCNKIAQTENSIQIMQLVDLTSSLVNQGESLESKLACEEIEMLKQELNQIHRKKEEALYLKNGIDKRAVIVFEFLSKYQNREQLEEFENFLSSKIINALKQRHLKDHIELAQLQLKVLNDLKFK